MLEYRIRFIMLALVIVLSRQVGMVSAKTWHLEQGQDWKPLSAQSQDDKYLLDVAKIKRLVEAGQGRAVQEALNQLKKDFPEITGPDLDAFVEAEMLFCKGKYAKAAMSYDKFLAEYYHESELYKAALVRRFHIATAFLAGRKKTVLGVFKIKGYAEGKKIMEGISNQAGLDEPNGIGIKAAVAVAESLERRGKFNDAYLKWSEIWETGQIGKDALLGMARCRYAAYKGPKFDASVLMGQPFRGESYYGSAKGCYEEFKSQWPENAEEIDEILKEIDEKLAEKQFSIGRYYQKTGNKESAYHYYRMVIGDWPDSKAAEMAKQMMGAKGPPRNLHDEKVEK